MKIDSNQSIKNIKMSKKNYLVYLGLFLISLLVILSLYYFTNAQTINISGSTIENSLKNPIFEKPKMTEFDIQLAKKLMDKDNDGRCDVCGMDVNICIESGQLECNMGSKSTIGILDSEHLHVDFGVYLNGQKIDFNQEKYFIKSAFAHVEQKENSKETGNVLHIHAKGTPLWLFFKSLDMILDSNCFKLDSKQFCNNKDNKLRFFVNGIENNQFGDYIPKNLDKILITYGNYDGVNEQLNSITDYAKNH